jgi:hypothetical protein
VPTPWVCGGWIAGANADRADMHITIVDQPSFLIGVTIAAAAEGWHAM